MSSRRNLKTSPTLSTHLIYESLTRNTYYTKQFTTPSRNPSPSHLPKDSGKQYTHAFALVILILHNVIENIKNQENVRTTSIPFLTSHFQIKNVTYHTCFSIINQHSATPFPSISVHHHTTVWHYQVKQNKDQN